MRLTRRRWLAAGTLVAALALLVGSLAIAEALRYAHAPTRIAIQATPIASFDIRDPAKTRFGRLEFRGGLVLTSNEQAFGGISAIHMEPDGAHFLAVTDQSSWLRGSIVYRDGHPSGIAEAEMAPMLGHELCLERQPRSDRGHFDGWRLGDEFGAEWRHHAGNIPSINGLNLLF